MSFVYGQGSELRQEEAKKRRKGERQSRGLPVSVPTRSEAGSKI